jgi:hypothetical protein
MKWLLLALAACTGDDSSSSARGPVSADSASGALHAVVVTTPDPLQRGVNQAVVTLTGGDGSPRAGLTVTVTPWMPAHGHGSAVTPSVNELGGGKYQVSNLYLAMPGSWQLRIDAMNDEVVPSLEVP